ncbi:hypothetical protein CYJ36_08090 [Bacillus sp. UMB0893]|nr:hypothetical protein CYJ36_08090 [Bacillus sp. UMB0893]
MELDINEIKNYTNAFSFKMLLRQPLNSYFFGFLSYDFLGKIKRKKIFRQICLTLEMSNGVSRRIRK